MDKLHKKKMHPRHAFEGELVQYVLVDANELRNLESKQRYIVTSLVKRKDNNLIHIYLNGKRITGKRINKETPVLQESMSLIDWLIMRLKLGDIK